MRDISHEGSLETQLVSVGDDCDPCNMAGEASNDYSRDNIIALCNRNVRFAGVIEIISIHYLCDNNSQDMGKGKKTINTTHVFRCGPRISTKFRN